MPLTHRLLIFTLAAAGVALVGCDPVSNPTEDAAVTDAGARDAGPDAGNSPGDDAGEVDPCAGVDCLNGGTCAAGSCQCPSGTAGDRCELTGGCAASPCFDGVECSDQAGQSPNFSCADCPTGFTGDGVTCTAIEPPQVVSTSPDQDQVVRFTVGGFNPGEVNRIVVTFDRDVVLRPPGFVATANHLGSDFSETLSVRDRQSGGDNRVLTLDSAGASYTSFPSGAYEVTLENVRSFEGGTLATYTWGFVIRGCGDDRCDSDETSCTCAADCGACAGCCNASGACRPGTATNECGNNGASCGVCTGGDTCHPSGAGCI